MKSHFMFWRRIKLINKNRNCFFTSIFVYCMMTGYSANHFITDWTCLFCRQWTLLLSKKKTEESCCLTFSAFPSVLITSHLIAWLTFDEKINNILNAVALINEWTTHSTLGKTLVTSGPISKLLCLLWLTNTVDI